MINEIQPKIKFQNVVQCPFKTFVCDDDVAVQTLDQIGSFHTRH